MRAFIAIEEAETVFNKKVISDFYGLVGFIVCISIETTGVLTFYIGDSYFSSKELFTNFIFADTGLSVGVTE
jgi:hypothetical protein